MVMPRSSETWPSSGGSWPEIIRKSVVLPAPFGPTRPIFSPFWRAAEASMKRIWWPTCLLTLSRRIIGARKEGNRCGRCLGHLEGWWKRLRTNHLKVITQPLGVDQDASNRLPEHAGPRCYLHLLDEVTRPRQSLHVLRTDQCKPRYSFNSH